MPPGGRKRTPAPSGRTRGRTPPGAGSRPRPGPGDGEQLPEQPLVGGGVEDGEAVIAHGRHLGLDGPVPPLTFRTRRSGSIAERGDRAAARRAEGNQGLEPDGARPPRRQLVASRAAAASRSRRCPAPWPATAPGHSGRRRAGPPQVRQLPGGSGEDGTSGAGSWLDGKGSYFILPGDPGAFQTANAGGPREAAQGRWGADGVGHGPGAKKLGRADRPDPGAGQAGRRWPMDRAGGRDQGSPLNWANPCWS
jgi:hypothetical protein